MSLLHLQLASITEKHIQNLIDGNVAESRNVEYKRELYGQSDADHAEWLADLSSFANTAGGDIIFGIEAKAGVPIKICSLSVSLDPVILKLEQIAQANLQPRVVGLEFKAVEIASGGQILIVRIPRSYNPPHRIVRQGKGQNRFWARSSAGKYEPNVDELRLLFTFAPQISERMRNWRFNRISAIVADDIPVQLIDRTCLILHLIPFSSFDPAAVISLGNTAEQAMHWAPIGTNSPQNWRTNFDGLLLTSNAELNATSQRAYTQVYRSGRVEAVASSIASGDRPQGVPPRLQTMKLEGLVLNTLTRYLKAFQAQAIEPPYAMMISLTGVKGAMINVGATQQWHGEDDMAVLDRDQYHFSEVILESVPQDVQECAGLIRPFIEQLANLAGHPTSTSFDQNGNYVRHR
jgi:hypothetical protein